MIQMNDLTRQYEMIKGCINERIDTVLNQGKYIMGPEVKRLEEKLKAYVGVDYAVTCANGTEALLMTLMAWGIGAGDAIFTTPFTFIATAEVIAILGATPIFVDIEDTSFNMSAQRLEEAILKVIEEGVLRPKVILPVDLFGLPVDYERIEEIGKKYDLKILEDAAQSMGASIQGRKCGSFGDAAATSFFPAKPLGCYGDGGAIFTNDEVLYDTLQSIRVHGKGKDKYDNVRIGLNSRLDTLQAAILLEKLEIFDQELMRRNEIAEHYTKALAQIVRPPSIAEGYRSSWAQYSVLTSSEVEREFLQKQLNKSGVANVIYYKTPLHLQPAFENLQYKKGDFPVSEDVSRRILSIPMHAYLSIEEINHIIEAFEIIK